MQAMRLPGRRGHEALASVDESPDFSTRQSHLLGVDSADYRPISRRTFLQAIAARMVQRFAALEIVAKDHVWS
ncbi:MAG TPA: hypothetical protein DDY41_08730 [Arthrobacter bacterium]|nr:hypothetical protein [Arthrobacter sp.]